MNGLAPIGKVTKEYGNDGKLLIQLYDTFGDGTDIREPLFAIIDSLAVPLFIESFTRRGNSSAIAVFSDLQTSSRASLLIGHELYSQPPITDAETDDSEEDDDDGELYMEDLVGFDARFRGKDLRGTIDGFIDSDTNPLISIEVSSRQVLVPAVDEMIRSVSVRKRTVTFDLPNGLLELYLD